MYIFILDILYILLVISFGTFPHIWDGGLSPVTKHSFGWLEAPTMWMITSGKRFSLLRIVSHVYSNNTSTKPWTVFKLRIHKSKYCIYIYILNNIYIYIYIIIYIYILNIRYIYKIYIYIYIHIMYIYIYIYNYICIFNTIYIIDAVFHLDATPNKWSMKWCWSCWIWEMCRIASRMDSHSVESTTVWGTWYGTGWWWLEH